MMTRILSRVWGDAFADGVAVHAAWQKYARLLRWPIRRASLLTAVGLMLAAAGGATLLSRAAAFLIIDSPAPSDLILVVSGDVDSRLPKAVQLWKSGYANEIVVDGGTGRSWLGRTEADRIEAQVQSLGSAAAHIRVCPIMAASTLEEAKAFPACIARSKAKTILLVTSEFHSRRALSTFRSALPGYQWSVAAVANPEAFGMSWWSDRAWAVTTLKEWEKLFWWEAVERWTA